MRRQSQIVHGAVVVERLPARMLDNAAVGADRDEADVGTIALTPEPLVEAFEPAQALRE